MVRFSKSMFLWSGTLRRDCGPWAVRNELPEHPPLWAGSEHSGEYSVNTYVNTQLILSEYSVNTQVNTQWILTWILSEYSVILSEYSVNTQWILRWILSEYSGVPCLRLPHARGERCDVWTRRAPRVQARGGHLPRPTLLGPKTFLFYILTFYTFYDLHILTQVTCPVLLFWGQKDWMAQPRGVAAIAARLPGLIDSVKVSKKTVSYTFENLHKVDHEKWNHLDFMWGQEAPTLLFPQILEVGFNLIICFLQILTLPTDIRSCILSNHLFSSNIRQPKVSLY